MARSNNKHAGGKNKVYTLPCAGQKRKDGGIPKLPQLKVGKQQTSSAFNKAAPPPSTPHGAVKSITALASRSRYLDDNHASSSSSFDNAASGSDYAPVDAALSTRDSSSKAFLRELRKVIERSDVIIQVLDARDPEGTRSRWVEEEVRKRDAQGKKLLAVVNKIDLVPRSNLEAWLKHLRHSFPCMPFKSSTQNQRHNLSQNAVPIIQTPTIPGQSAPKLPELPSTSSSLGAPALLNLLKQYALTTPHSSLTVGVVGYPNVGKSSLINSLKRSRACGVAAMPGKTRVVQEVVLDKGVKILDCPGVVLEDFGKDMDTVDGKKRQAEIMLRNCVKAELVEDPTAPVEVILDRAEHHLLRDLYNIPPFTDLRDFLIKVALTRGRLGKGGIPDLEAAAVTVLRDWNSGKIPYYTKPPAVHPSSAPIPKTSAATATSQATDEDVVMDNSKNGGDQVGEAKILTSLSEAFTIDGLFEQMGDDAAWEGDEGFVADVEEDITEADVVKTVGGAKELLYVPTRFDFSAPLSPSSDASSPRSDASSLPGIQTSRPIPSLISTADTATCNSSQPRPRQPSFTSSTFAPPPSLSSNKTAFQPRTGGSSHPSRLFTSEELLVLPTENMFDRQKLKQQAKKARKRQLAAEKTEGELMLGFMGMEVDEAGMEMYKDDEESIQASAISSRATKRVKKDIKKKNKVNNSKSQNGGAQSQQQKKGNNSNGIGSKTADVDEHFEAIVDGGVEQTQKEADFAKFLASMGASDDDEL